MNQAQSYRVAAVVAALAVVGCGGRSGGGSGLTSTPSLPAPAINLQQRPAVAKANGQLPSLPNAAGTLNGRPSTSAGSNLYVASRMVYGCHPGGGDIHCSTPGDVEVYAESDQHIGSADDFPGHK